MFLFLLYFMLAIYSIQTNIYILLRVGLINKIINMISNDTGIEKLGEDNNDSTIAKENNIKILVVAEQIPISSEVESKKRKSKQCLFHK